MTRNVAHKIKKLGVMGGTFDPIHNGHLVAAQEVLCTLGLDHVLFMPANQPPHKMLTKKTSIEQRISMVELAIASNPAFGLSRIDADRPGFKGFTLKHKMGMRAATTGRIELKDYKIPVSHQLGEVGKGFRYAMATLDGARIGVAAQGVGIAQRALDEAVSYAKSRIAFGAPIAKLQAIQWMIADMATHLEAARALTYKAAQMQDKGEKFTVEASQAKLFASEAARFCIDRAMQIHGGYGYIGEFSIIEKLYRDQRVLEIYEGTSEVQRLVIAGNYLR
jgi:butyryl-CoA dehydrogenase